MNQAMLFHEIEKLPDNLKKEVSDFINFLLYKNNPKRSSNRKRNGFGCLKGKISMTEDFNSPLEEFKDYM